ncbi:hypothetical protein AC249_AIPGENE15544 [Exaiptasia diaphana]|nr:hypothetical protein AC249_AIPGENE15544 [Exaiptasia diaphana]
MDKDEYIRLLKKASVDHTNKFRVVSTERPKKRGRPPKYYHPLLEKEKDLHKTVHRILPGAIAECTCVKGSRLAHLYGLPKTHKEKLAIRPILSATSTYNYALAKWLEVKLKPLSYNRYSILDIFKFADEIRNKEINQGDILVSYDVTSLFTNVPLDKTISLLVDKAFHNNWFNLEYDLNITKQDLTDLLNAATKDQLFQFDGVLYEQFDGVAMGSPLGPLLANVFMCSIEEQLEHDGNMPSYYRRYVDDTLTIMPDVNSANVFLKLLNERYKPLEFTIEFENQHVLPFVGMQLNPICV